MVNKRKIQRSTQKKKIRYLGCGKKHLISSLAKAKRKRSTKGALESKTHALFNETLGGQREKRFI
jgi:hypothetical protein